MPPWGERGPVGSTDFASPPADAARASAASTDPTDGGQTVLGEAALDERALSPSSATTPPLERPFRLRKYEPDLEAVGAVEAALRAAAPDGWERVADALAPVFGRPPVTASDLSLARANESLARALDPTRAAPVPRWVDLGQAAEELVTAAVEGLGEEAAGLWGGDPRAEFCVGLVLGTGESLLEGGRALMQLVETVLDKAVGFYTLVYDVNVLHELLRIYLLGAPGDELASYLRTDYPELWRAISSGPAMGERIETIGKRLSEEPEVALKAVGDWIDRLPVAIGEQLRPHVDAVVAAKGDPGGQGKIIGGVVGPVVIDILSAVLGLVGTVRGVLRVLSKRALEGVRGVGNVVEEAAEEARKAALAQHRADDLTAAAEIAEAQAPGLSNAAQQVAGGVLSQIVREYGELSEHLGPHWLTRRRTGAWNKSVRDLADLTEKDLEYAVSLRLDSSHIIGDEWFDKFPTDFRQVFQNWAVLDSRGRPVMHRGQPLVVSWKSGKDMDTFPMHTEAHIRSGRSMAKEHGLMGAEGMGPLREQMNTYFADWQAEHGKFKGIRDVVTAHHDYWQKKWGPTEWPRLEAWFERVEAALVKAGK